MEVGSAGGMLGGRRDPGPLLAHNDEGAVAAQGFEVKPDEEESREEGREQAGRYLAALNGAVDPDPACGLPLSGREELAALGAGEVPGA